MLKHLSYAILEFEWKCWNSSQEIGVQDTSEIENKVENRSKMLKCCKSLKMILSVKCELQCQGQSWNSIKMLEFKCKFSNQSKC